MTEPVSINGRFLTRPATGVDRFAWELMRAWIPLHGKSRGARAVIPRASQVEGASLDVPVEPVGNFQGHAWEQFDLPRRAREDVLLSLCNTGPIASKRQLAVLHDAGVMANASSYNAAFRHWYRFLFTGLMRRSAVVATVSKFSASELIRHVGRRAAGVEVIYESGEHVLRTPGDQRILERLGLQGRRYVLAVGSRTPNKNLAGVAKAAALLGDLDIKVVAAGGSNSRVFAGVDLSGENLVLAGYVSDAELRSLYENAQCFVFPSFYEGFGLPPLEAMHCGCPVVASKRASMPEICGDAAAYCDPSDPYDIANSIRRVLTSNSLRNELQEAGLARVKSFTWSNAAAQLEQLIANGFDGGRA